MENSAIKRNFSTQCFWEHLQKCTLANARQKLHSVNCPFHRALEALKIAAQDSSSSFRLNLFSVWNTVFYNFGNSRKGTRSEFWNRSFFSHRCSRIVLIFARNSFLGLLIVFRNHPRHIYQCFNVIGTLCRVKANKETAMKRRSQIAAFFAEIFCTKLSKHGRCRILTVFRNFDKKSNERGILNSMSARSIIGHG